MFFFFSTVSLFNGSYPFIHSANVFNKTDVNLIKPPVLLTVYLHNCADMFFVRFITYNYSDAKSACCQNTDVLHSKLGTNIFYVNTKF